MAAAQEQQSGGDEEEREEYAWLSQTPTTRLVGTPVDIIYSGQISETTAQNDTSFGLVLEDASVVGGSLWANQVRDGELTSEAVADDEPRPTDYRVVDEDDRNTTIANGALVTDENGPNTYSETDEITEDRVIVWYNGMSGERLSRVLDFNGRPFADFNEYGLVKGLYQVHPDWRDANADARSEMKENGKAPRVVRLPLLRFKTSVEREDGSIVGGSVLDDPNPPRVLIDMSRFMGGRGYEIHVFDADEFEDEFGSLDAEIPREDSGYVKDDIESEFEMPYVGSAADDILEDAGISMQMYTGEGWQDEPNGYTPQSTSEVSSFGIGADEEDESTDDEGGLSAEEQQFIDEVADDVRGTGMTPAERYDGGVTGLLEKHDPDGTSSEEEIRAAIYADVAHLDVGDLGK